MTEYTKLRLKLLKVITYFKIGTPDSINIGLELVKKIVWDTSDKLIIGKMIWESFFIELTDSIFYTDKEYLQDAFEQASGIKPGNQVILCNFDETDTMIEENDSYTEEERILKKLLTDAFRCFEGISDDNTQEKEATFRQICLEICKQQQKIPVSPRLYEENLFRFLLNDIANIIINIDIRRYIKDSVLTISPPYRIVGRIGYTIKMDHILESIKSVLESFEGKRWLYVNIHYDNEIILISYL